MTRKKRATPKLQKAVAFLHSFIEESVKKKSTRLPPMLTLAKMADVSIVVMHRAVEILKKEGYLTTAPRKGIHINKVRNDEKGYPKFNLGGQDETHDLLEAKWVRIKECIVNDIVGGRYLPGTIVPSVKELCWHYGASAPTLKRALDTLVGEGKLVRYKRGYKVFQVSPLARTGTVIVIAQHDIIHQLLSYSPILYAFFTTLEQQQYTMHYRMQIISYIGLLYNVPNPQFTSIRAIERSYFVVGYIIVTTALKHKQIRLLLELFRSIQKPVALFDDSGFSYEHRTFFVSPYIRMFELASYRKNPGTVVGNYLMTRGHDKIAYFNSYPDYQWSVRRYGGIHDAFAAYHNRFQIHYLETSKSEPLYIMSSSTHALERMFDTNVSEKERLHYHTTYYRPVQEYSYYRKLMEPLFVEALRNSSITAWVGANDLVALMAYFYLLRNKARDSEKIALIGFDNSLESFTYSISSFNFNPAAAVHSILEYIFTPLRTIRQEKISAVEIPGMIIERKSTC
jgi:DNA-binding GntR family transcriptional regulator/DNA-binding LacI/PurR family transcriptional regulator